MAMTKCKECGKEVSSTAEMCPHCGHKPKRTSGCAMIAAVFIAVVVVVSVVARCSGSDSTPTTASTPAPAVAQPRDDLEVFVQRFGEPDSDTSTENEQPRPPIVTRRLVYAKERVRAVYVPDAPATSAPPYAKWKLMGFQDERSNAVLQPAEAVERLKARDKGRR